MLRLVIHYFKVNEYVCVRSVSQQCLTLFDPIDCSPPGSSVHGIFQARIVGQFAISYSRGSSRPRDQTQVSWLLHWQVNPSPLSHLGSPRSMNTSGRSFKNDFSFTFPATSSSFISFNIYLNCYYLCGEGNGTPLQYSCLENPMDGGAW